MDDLQASLDMRGIKWHFNPPHASHFGGAWERKIGALKRVMDGSMSQLGGRTLSRDEFATLLYEAMAIVNNTPMWEISSSPQDPIPISPAMILTGKGDPHPSTFESHTEKDLSNCSARRWRRVQLLADEFWRRWRTYYLSDLRERSKWARKRRNVCVGDLVILVNKAEKRNRWPMAIVREVKTSSDGFVRSVQLETAPGGATRKIFNRPISEVILLIPSERTVPGSRGSDGLSAEVSGEGLPCSDSTSSESCDI